MTPVSRTIRLGLTGGIGSGKSTAAGLLGQKGAYVIDADHISRQLSGPGGGAIEALRTAFGEEFIDAQGAMNRAKMRQWVFQDPSAKCRLESIMHPLIYGETERLAEQASQQGTPLVVFDLPLLVESGRWRSRLDHVLVIDCAPAVQRSRVQARSGLALDEIERIMAQQATRLQRLAAADSVVNNDSPDLNYLAASLDQFLAILLPGAKSIRAGTPQEPRLGL